ncbi:MAG: ribulose-phosphate 3-epimerase [Cyclobacteriaceae bacterium]
MLISPSILAADFANIQIDTELLNRSEADYIHIDLMDGVFVPNISFGFPVTKAIHKHAEKALDFHLMLANPDPYLEACKQSGASIISVHYETCPHLHRTLQAIRDLDCKAGVAVNPHTSVNLLTDIIDQVDVVLLMSVNPGFGGQQFIENTYRKVQDTKELISKRNASALIEIDGGVNLENAPLLKHSGADMLVAGSFVFNSEDPINTISGLKAV